ncbi:MAG: nickel ABC transporter substrate-binding protein [Cetobacterium sp.]
MKKKIKILTFCIMLLIGCGKESSNTFSKDNTLKVTSPKDIGELNPHLMTSSQFIQDWVYEGLVTLKDGEIKPVLAQSWTISSNGKEYIFSLRKDVKFSDGSEFDANLAKKNIDSILENKKRFGFLQSLQEISRVDAVDKYTLKLVLNNPCNSLLKDLTFTRPITFLGEKGFSKIEPTYKKIELPIGTGMWKIIEHVQNQYAIFERNEYYWGKKPNYKYVKVLIVPDMNTTVSMLKAGEIDLIFDNLDSLSVDSIKDLKNSGFEVKISNSKQITSLSLNTNKGILKNKKVRQALAYATNNEIISKNIFESDRKPAKSYFTDDVEYVKNSKVENYEFNLEKSNQLLESLGWIFTDENKFRSKDGKILELTISIDNSFKNGKVLAEVLQHQYSKVGVKINISQEESKLFRQNWSKADFDIIMFNSWGASYEPFATFAAMTTSGDKFNVVQRGVQNQEELHKNMLNALSEVNEEKLQKNIDYIIHSFYDEAIYIPLTDTVITAVFKKNLEGIQFSDIKEAFPLQDIIKK